MVEEINALIWNRTWTFISPSPSINVIGCKWVYWVKHHTDRPIEQYKASLVAMGFYQ